MGFKIENKSSLRLSAIPASAIVALMDFQTGKQFATARFDGFRNGNDELIPAPGVMKSAPQDTTILFTVFEPVKNEAGEETGEVTETALRLVKDPAGFGCFFRNVAEEGQPAKLRRVTVYAESSVVAKVHADRAEASAKRKAEIATAKAKAELEAAEAGQEKPKRGRKPKAKEEIPTVTETTETATVEETTEA